MAVPPVPPVLPVPTAEQAAVAPAGFPLPVSIRENCPIYTKASLIYGIDLNSFKLYKYLTCYNAILYT